MNKIEAILAVAKEIGKAEEKLVQLNSKFRQLVGEGAPRRGRKVSAKKVAAAARRSGQFKRMNDRVAAAAVLKLLQRAPLGIDAIRDSLPLSSERAGRVIRGLVRRGAVKPVSVPVTSSVGRVRNFKKWAVA